MDPIKKFCYPILAIFLLLLVIPNFHDYYTNIYANELNIPEGYEITKHTPEAGSLENDLLLMQGTLQASDNKIREMERIYNMEATGYTKECGYPWDDGYTFTGAEAKTGRTVAVDPQIIPLGTELTIEGFDGVFIAEDVGAAIKDYKIDVYFGEGEEARRKALNFGRREVRVRVIESR